MLRVGAGLGTRAVWRLSLCPHPLHLKDTESVHLLLRSRVQEDWYISGYHFYWAHLFIGKRNFSPHLSRRVDGHISSNICGNPKTAGTTQNQCPRTGNFKFFLIPHILYGSEEQDFTSVLYSTIPLLSYLLLCVLFSFCFQLVFCIHLS